MSHCYDSYESEFTEVLKEVGTSIPPFQLAKSFFILNMSSFDLSPKIGLNLASKRNESSKKWAVVDGSMRINCQSVLVLMMVHFGPEKCVKKAYFEF